MSACEFKDKCRNDKIHFCKFVYVFYKITHIEINNGLSGDVVIKHF